MIMASHGKHTFISQTSGCRAYEILFSSNLHLNVLNNIEMHGNQYWYP
jgi:hypothetical protein